MPEFTADAGSAPAPKPAAPVLVRVDAPEAQTIRLHRALTIVGTKAHSHLRIVSTEISGTHAVLLNLGNNVFLRDLMSRTHTYVNDQKVSECRLKYGDVIRFGQMQFRFVDLDVLRQSLPAARSAPAELQWDDHILLLSDRSPVFVIGRQRGADLRLSSGPLSRIHAVIYEHAGKHVLRDLSRHGTLVDGQPIRSLELQPGQIIEIGTTQFRYQSRDGATPASTRGTARQSKAPPAEPRPAQPDAATDGSEDDVDAPGEQHVFAPEAEILSDRPSDEVDDDGAPTDTFDSADDLSDPQDDPPEEGAWELSAQESADSPTIKLQSGRADSGTEHAESAGDLLDWGFTVERDRTTASTPEAVTSPDTPGSGVSAAFPAAETGPAVPPPAVGPEPFPPTQHADAPPLDGSESQFQPASSTAKSRRNDTVPSRPEGSFLSGAVDLEALTEQASDPDEARRREARGRGPESAPTAKRPKRKSQTFLAEPPVAPQPRPELRRKARKLQPLDGILGEEVLTFGAPSEQTPAEAPPPARRSSGRIVLIVTAILLLIAAAAGAWWFLHGRS